MVIGVQWTVGLLIDRNDIPRRTQKKVKCIGAVGHRRALIPTFVEVERRRFGINVFSFKRNAEI